MSRLPSVARHDTYRFLNNHDNEQDIQHEQIRQILRH